MEFAIQHIAVRLPQFALIHLRIGQRGTQPGWDALGIQEETTRQGRPAINLRQVNIGIEIVTGHDHMVERQPAPLLVLIHAGMNTKAQMGIPGRHKGHAGGEIE
jgi:hypothetical protein